MQQKGSGKLTNLVACLVIVVGSLGGEVLSAQAADPPKLVRTTTWGHHTAGGTDSSIRGLAYDGDHYYIADHSDYLIDGRAWDFTGRIYIYNENGFVKRLPENPPVFGVGFPHGVATDGTKLWTTDYFGGNVYEYEIASGQLLRSFVSPISQPVRLDFDASTRTLWMTGYDNPNIYQVNLSGVIVSSFPTSGLGLNKNVALDGKGGMLIASSEGNMENLHLLRRYSTAGTLLKDYANFYTAYWAMATNINDRRFGFIQDAQPVWNSIAGRYEAHIEHYRMTPPTEVMVNNLVTFVPIISSYRTTSDPAGCPSGFGGKFSFDARLTNRNGSPPISDLVVQVNTLTNGNLLQNADGGNGGIGSTLTVVPKNGYSDGNLSPEEFVDVNFSICLEENRPFTFFVDVLGTR